MATQTKSAPMNTKEEFTESAGEPSINDMLERLIENMDRTTAEMLQLVELLRTENAS
jgi:hypothetical protein